MIENINIFKDVIVVVGPTSVGKSTTAIMIAKKYDCDVISADACQVYKKMDIGTAKVMKKEMDGVVHHFIDIVDYKTSYNVSDFQKQARKIVDMALSSGKKIVIAGGTGLFVSALIYDYNFNENENYKKIKSFYSSLGLEQLQKLVSKNELNNSDYNNKRRIESYLCKKDLNFKDERFGDKLIYDVQIIGLTTSREELYQNINDRVDMMFINGLVKEVEMFESDYLSQNAIGYKELHSYFAGEISFEEAKEKIKKKSRNFAKRQYTWYNNKMNVQWYQIKDGIWQLLKS